MNIKERIDSYLGCDLKRERKPIEISKELMDIFISTTYSATDNVSREFARKDQVIDTQVFHLTEAL